MQKLTILLFVSVALASFRTDDPIQKHLRSIKNEAFKPGEKLTYKIHYGFIDAGEATLEVAREMKTFGGRACYRVTGSGKSVGAFDWFFKVRDTYESTIDTQAIIPWFFKRRVNEGGFIIKQDVTFNHYQDSAISEKKTIYIPANTQDLVSACYYARTLDFSHVKEGQIFEIQGYVDDQLIPLNIKCIGKEIIKSKKGQFHCLKFRPMLQQGRVFKKSESMTVWISDDKNHIPVRVQTEILVGSIKMDLVDFENLANEPAIVKD